ncbi:MAG: hypothetical protein NTX22_01855 [Ignavibacteriales bacterium]|nr:hypothetical protein [Ignavibacteriales bacterium]
MKNCIKYLLLPILLILAIINSVNAQEKIDSYFEQKENKIYIYYELKGDPLKEYEISDLILKRKSEPNFSIEPTSLSGDIGTGKYASGKRTIIWSVNESEQDEISKFSEADDFIFEFTVSLVTEGTSWYYYVGGAVLLGGGTAAAIILLKGKDNNSNPPNNSGFPLPPGRP